MINQQNVKPSAHVKMLQKLAKVCKNSQNNLQQKGQGIT